MVSFIAFDIKIQWNIQLITFSAIPGWISGEGAKAMEKLSDEEVLHDLWSLLKRLLGKDTPKPVRVIRCVYLCQLREVLTFKDIKVMLKQITTKTCEFE